jgi:hypothetical protein
MGSPLGSDKGAMKAPSQSSAKLNTSVGSGSRPGTSRHTIDTSAPMNPRTLDRDPPSGALGFGNGKEKARG